MREVTTNVRNTVIKRLIGKTISHDLKSPLHHFQDDLQVIIDDLDESILMSAVGTKLRSEIASLKNIASVLTDSFKKSADIIRQDSTTLKIVRETLEKEVEPIKKELINCMTKILSILSSRYNYSTLNLKDLNRFKTNVDNFYNAAALLVSKDFDDTNKKKNTRTNIASIYNNLIKSMLIGVEGINITENVIHTNEKSIECVQAQIKVCIQNILLNAVRFSDWSFGEKKVNYKISRYTFNQLRIRYPKHFNKYNASGEWIVFNIRNSGEKIPKAEAHRIFHLSAKLSDKSHERYGGGNGIGLAISKLMCIENKGLVFLDTSNKEMTDFCICLPTRPCYGIDRTILFEKEYDLSKL